MKRLNCTVFVGRLLADNLGQHHVKFTNPVHTTIPDRDFFKFANLSAERLHRMLGIFMFRVRNGVDPVIEGSRARLCTDLFNDDDPLMDLDYQVRDVLEHELQRMQPVDLENISTITDFSFLSGATVTCLELFINGAEIPRWTNQWVMNNGQVPLPFLQGTDPRIPNCTQNRRNCRSWSAGIFSSRCMSN